MNGSSIHILGTGLVIGFSIAAPVGPIGILCISRTLTQGRLIGLLTGLGATLADAIYGLLAAFGVTAVISVLVHWSPLLNLVGAMVLLALGIKTWRLPSPAPVATVATVGYWRACTSALLLTLANPMTIISFSGVLAGLLDPADQSHSVHPILLVVGVAGGSAAWWIVLSLSVGVLRRHMDDGLMIWVRRGSGTVLIISGLIAAGNGCQRLSQD